MHMTSSGMVNSAGTDQVDSLCRPICFVSFRYSFKLLTILQFHHSIKTLNATMTSLAFCEETGNYIFSALSISIDKL